MRVISLNANGLRAAARKGFYDWMQTQAADFVCIQETKAQIHQLEDAVFKPAGYHFYCHDALKPGYSGTAIYSRHEPKKVTTGLGFELADSEGRYVQLDFDELSVASIYLPSGASKESRQIAKYDFMDRYEPMLQAIAKQDKPFIICGDWNIVHKEIDIKNWKSNQKNSGCLPEERAWLDKLFVSIGLFDAFRLVNSNAQEYTWWSNRGRAWDNNVGWRIDYQVITPSLKNAVKSAHIYKDQRFSDHAPLIMDYHFDLKT